MAELTTEEKEKIYLEEKTRFEARQVLKIGNSKIMFGNILALAGSVMLLIGLFLPWVTLGFIQVSGWAKAEDSRLLLIPGIAAVLVSIYGLYSQKRFIGIFELCSFISIGLLVFIYFQLKNNLPEQSIFGVKAQIGGGFWLSLVGASMILIGAAVMSQKNKKKSI